MIPGTCKHRVTDGCQHCYNLHMIICHPQTCNAWETLSFWSLIVTLLQQEPPPLTIVMSHMTFQKLVPDGQNIAQWPKQDQEHIFNARENFPPFTCCQLLTQRKSIHSIELHLNFFSPFAGVVHFLFLACFTRSALTQTVSRWQFTIVGIILSTYNRMKIFTDLQSCRGHLVLLGFMISFCRLPESNILMRCCVSYAYALGKKFAEM